MSATYQVEVTRSISVTVTVSADSAEAALEQVSRRDFPLPPRDEWDGHKDWEYTVYDADGGELVSTWDGGACGYSPEDAATGVTFGDSRGQGEQWDGHWRSL